MNWKENKEELLIFLKFIPSTIKKTSIWLIISYLIPIINIFIIWGIRKVLTFDINILNIILVTNACFITSLVFLIDKKREITNVLNVITLVFSIVLFAFSIAQMELKTQIFSEALYKGGALFTFILAILIGLVSKYDQVEAYSLEMAEKGKNKKKQQLEIKILNYE
jgi:hypothetical protein